MPPKQIRAPDPKDAVTAVLFVTILAVNHFAEQLYHLFSVVLAYTIYVVTTPYMFTRTYRTPDILLLRDYLKRSQLPYAVFEGRWFAGVEYRKRSLLETNRYLFFGLLTLEIGWPTK